MKKHISIFNAVLLMILAGVTVYIITSIDQNRRYTEMLEQTSVLNNILLKFVQTRDLVNSSYAGEFDQQELMDGALRGYIDALGNPRTVYLSKSLYTEYQNLMNSERNDIGVSCSYDEELRVLRVTTLFPNSPADNAGLRPGDVITSVGGYAVKTIGYDMAMGLLCRGTQNAVMLEIIPREEDDGGQTEILVYREPFKTPLVTGEIIEEDIGYVRIYNFTQNTAKEFKVEIDYLKSEGATSFIFDLRKNPGDMFEPLAEIMDILLPAGVIYTIEDKNGKSPRPVMSSPDYLEARMACIVDGDTVSAAEYFAAALQEHRVARIVGQITYGKGTLEKLSRLNDGSGLFITTLICFTPDGNNLSETGGVKPRIRVDISREDSWRLGALDLPHEEDAQLQAAIEYIKNV